MKSVDEIAALLFEQRKSIGLEQKDMYLRIGMKQQQYQRIEAGSDLKLSTLLRVLEGLDLELSIEPKRSKKFLIQANNTLQGQNEIDKNNDLEDDVDDLSFWFGSEESS